MLHPVLTILVASSIHVGADVHAPVDLAQIVVQLTQALPAVSPSMPQAEARPTVADLPYYYSDFTPVPAPAVEPIVTYDWRSPVIFDLP